MRSHLLCLLIPVVVLLSPARSAPTEPWAAPGSPFALGEEYPETPATCETVTQWIDKSPTINARVSFAVSGRLTYINSNNALAYLVMCEEKDVQILCVTYSANGRQVGDTVTFAGGYARAGQRRIMLDPCLVT